MRAITKTRGALSASISRGCSEISKVQMMFRLLEHTPSGSRNRGIPSHTAFQDSRIPLRVSKLKAVKYG